MKTLPGMPLNVVDIRAKSTPIIRGALSSIPFNVVDIPAGCSASTSNTGCIVKTSRIHSAVIQGGVPFQEHQQAMKILSGMKDSDGIGFCIVTISCGLGSVNRHKEVDNQIDASCETSMNICVSRHQ